MPPKKVDPKDAKKGQQAPGGTLIIDDDYSDLPSLPPLNSFIFSTLCVFKYKRNLQRLHQNLLKHYSYPAEDTVNSGKFKTVQRDELLAYARAKQYITEDELLACQQANTSSSLDEIMTKALGSYERYVEVFAKATVDVVLSYEVPARRAKKEQE